MKKATKKLLISALILVIAVSLATTTTFAWFTMNNEPEVEGFNVNVTAVDGLYISLEPLGDDVTAVVGKDGTYKSFITAAEVLDAIALHTEFTTNTEVGGPLKALAAANGTIAANEISFASQGTTLSDTELTANDTTHYTFRLYFRSNNAYTAKLNLVDSAVTSTTGATNLPIQAWKALSADEYPGLDPASVAIGGDVVAEAANAVMISFYNGTTTNVWDPNSGNGFTVNEPTEAIADPAEDAHNNIALDYYNFIKGGTPIEFPETNPIEANTVTASTTLLTLAGGTNTTTYDGYLDVSIWIEGWDANCFNSILDDQITTALKFVGAVA